MATTNLICYGSVAGELLPLVTQNKHIQRVHIALIDITHIGKYSDKTKYHDDLEKLALSFKILHHSD